MPISRRFFPILPVRLLVCVLAIGMTALAGMQSMRALSPNTDRAIAPTAPLADDNMDIGVLAGSDCGAYETITIRMDDEDSNPRNDIGGWVGLTSQDRNTKFVFCRVDGTEFQSLYSSDQDVLLDYIVLKLGDQCPNGAQTFSRYFDNQDERVEYGFRGKKKYPNKNKHTGNIYPNSTKGNVILHFCLFKGKSYYDDSNIMTQFPAQPFSYGVFAADLGQHTQAQGHVTTDEENTDNKNSFSFPPELTQTDRNRIVEIIYGGEPTSSHTYFNLIKVFEPQPETDFTKCPGTGYCKDNPRPVDLSIALYKTTTDSEKRSYEEAMQHFADAIYEMSNGVHIVRNVYFFPRGSGARVIWEKAGRANATRNGARQGGNIHMFDETTNQDAGYTLAHEMGHFYYGLADEYQEAEDCDVPKEIVDSPRCDDLPVEPSVMNDHYFGGSNLDWLNFSIRKNDTIINAQHRTFEAAGWPTLARHSSEDPPQSYVEPNLPCDLAGVEVPCNIETVLSGTPEKIINPLAFRRAYPELRAVAPQGNDLPSWQLNATGGKEKARARLNVYWWGSKKSPKKSPMLISDEFVQEQGLFDIPFYIDASLKEVNIRLDYESPAPSNVTLILSNPTGTALTPIGCPESGNKESRCTATLNNPAPGNWLLQIQISNSPVAISYEIEGVNQNDGPESYQPPYEASVHSAFGQGLKYPTPLFVIAQIGKGLPIAKANVTAYALTPDDQLINLTLKDDGVTPDAVVDDGLYTGFLPYALDGTYTVVATFDNQAGNAVYTFNRFAHYQKQEPVVENFVRSASTLVEIVGQQADDHGNICATATPLLSDNQGVFGHIDFAGDLDVFKVTTTEAGKLNVRISELTTDMAPKLRLLTADGSAVLKEGSFDPAANSYLFLTTDTTVGATYCMEVSQLNPAAISGYYVISAGQPLSSGSESTPLLQLSATVLTFNAVIGSNPTNQSFMINNVGAGTLAWTANEAISWLTLSTLSGNAPATVQATVDSAGLTPGEYSGTITVNAGTQSATITVKLQVSSLPPITPTKPITLGVESSNKSMELTWNVTNDPLVSKYRILRSPNDGSNLTVIADDVVNTTYFDTDDNAGNNLQEGTTYCYQVEALHADNSLALQSNLGCGLFGTLDLWVPDTVGKPGETVLVPINIRNADGLRIGASDVWLDFNATVIESVAISRTALTGNYAWAHAVNPIDATTSRVRIAYIHSDLSNPPPELHGDGSLFWLTFRVKGTPGSTSPLNLKEFISNVGGSSIQNEGLADVDLNLTDGLFRVEGTSTAQYILGDVDGDTLVRARDAALALHLANDERTPSELELLAGDVNGNGKIDAADSSMILYFAAKNEWPQPPKPLVGAASIAETAQSATITLGNGQGKPGQSVALTLSATGLSKVAGASFVLVYDPRIVQAISNVSKSGLAANVQQLEYYADGTGLLYLALSNESEISGDGALATIAFLLAANAPVGVAPVTLAEAKLNDGLGRDFVTSFASNSLTRQSGQITVQAADPVNNSRTLFLPLIRR